ncbi:MAG TPA: GNAT family N-acetyltransferase [Sphingomonas sp.]|jgi:RimJ/RimL family protein N-acetyltransferase|uniref:GNAT family N-acetyltransferase n=1 Tax=Sphingomonas sp. TaxID=28214 RepID=UPI002ED919B4
MTGPTLATARLTLAPHGPADLEEVAAMWADPRVTEHIGGRPLSREECWRTIQRYVGHWTLFPFGYLTVRETATGLFLGEVGCMDSRRDTAPSFEGTPEAGWAFAPAAQGRGFAREAVAALLAWADAQGIARTVCLIDHANAPSVRLAEAVGFRAAGDVTYRDAPTRLFERVAPA